MSQQLVKKKLTGGYDNVMPKSWIEAIKDKNTGQSLVEILQGFNMYFLPYKGNTPATRCLVPTILRKKGLWITYVKYDGNVYTEWYAANEIDNKSWGDSSNWRVGNNTLVGDITISANGNWVINGTETKFKAVGEKGNTPLLRVANNRLQVSYDFGDTYIDVTNNPVYTKFRWLATSGDTQASNVGRIQVSIDEGKTWTNMSNDFINNLHISRYIGVNESLPTSGIAEGTIYAKGPTYDEGDTSNSNPIYRLWVYAWKDNTLAWQDNGEFTSIAAGVVQETGYNENAVMSQKATTETIHESFVKGGIIDEELKKRQSIEYGGLYIPFEFKSGEEYIIRLIPSSNATLQVVFTSTTESTETKIDQFNNITLVANEIQEIRYIPSADANYWHYYCGAADLSCTLEIIQYVQGNVNEKISPIKEIVGNLSCEIYGTDNISHYTVEDNRIDYCVISGGTIVRNTYAKYVVSGYISLPDNWTKIKLADLIDGGGSRYWRLSETTQDSEVGYADGLKGTEFEIDYTTAFANYKYLTFTAFAAPSGTPVPDLSGIKVYLYKKGLEEGMTALEERVTALEEENMTPDKMSFSKRCFDFGQKSPQKPCVTITFDVLANFSFGANKDLFDYINFLDGYGIPASSFFIRPTAGQIGNVADYVNAYKIGQDICIHSIHTDSFGDNDTENPHPSLAEAEVLLQNYQKWFKTNGFPYSMGWVTSRGQLYAPYFDLLPKYISYGHTLSNHDIKAASDVSDLYPYINKRTDDRMKIIRLGIENLQADGDAEETKIINYAKALIDKTIETNGFLCLYGHGFDNMSAPYTMRESVLTGILTYLKTKIDNLEILVGSEAEIVPYFYD